MQRNLTLTTVGLPVRDELRIKSLLSVISPRTRDAWSFCDDESADVALCDPQSAMSAVLLKRSKEVGAPRCVSLVEEGSSALDDTLTIRNPVQASELALLLNMVSAEVVALHEVPSGGGTESAEPSVDTQLFHVASSLLRLLRCSTRDVFEVTAGDLTLHVVPPSRTILANRRLDGSAFRQLADPQTVVKINQIAERKAPQAGRGGTVGYPADVVLWQLGVHGPRNVLLPTLPEKAQFKLRRWPDFGLFEYGASHLRIAAHLFQNPASVDELVGVLDQPADQIRPFINGCALGDLLSVQMPEGRWASAGAIGELGAARPARSSRIFGAIRAALRMG